MNNITYSFIIPVYNVESYLSRCIESVLNQSESFFEVLLIDDGSTDRSSSICDEYAQKNSKIRVTHTSNNGLSSARNLGLKEAIGDYIVFVDSDDYIEQDFLFKMRRLTSENKNVEIFTANYYKFTEGQRFIHTFSPMNKMTTGNEFLKHQLKNGSFTNAAWRNVYLREFIVKNNLFFKENIIYEDQIWTPQVFFAAQRVLVTDIVFYNYIVRPGSITQSKNKDYKAYQILNNANEMISIINTLEDIELRNLLGEKLLSDNFLAFKMGKHINKQFIYDTHFMKHHASTFKIKVRVYLFTMNRFIYYYLTRFNPFKIIGQKIRYLYNKRPLVEINKSINHTVLLLGSGRSGTTWLSLQIIESGSYRYIFEPFKLHKGGAFNDFVDSEIPIYEAIKDKSNFDNRIVRMLTGTFHSNWMDRHNKKRFSNQRLVKLIRANLMIDYFQEKFPSLKMLYIIRSPFQVVNSRLQLNWKCELLDIINNSKFLEKEFLAQKDLILKIYHHGELYEKHLILWSIQNYFALKHLNQNNYRRLIIYDEILKGSSYELSLIKEVTGKKILKSKKVFDNESFTSKHVGSNADRVIKWQKSFSQDEINQMIHILKMFDLDQIINFDDFSISRDKFETSIFKSL